MQREWKEKRLPPPSQYKREVAAVEVKGTFNAQRFFETLALILSERENAKITVKVTQQQEKKKEAQAAGQQPAAVMGGGSQ